MYFKARLRASCTAGPLTSALSGQPSGIAAGAARQRCTCARLTAIRGGCRRCWPTRSTHSPRAQARRKAAPAARFLARCSCTAPSRLSAGIPVAHRATLQPSPPLLEPSMNASAAHMSGGYSADSAAPAPVAAS